ncbi:7-carboxy-7-deazaguanine synthase QueE [Rhodobacteraceae bacterium NNCM2]|nr:7-carboxy-7-deazaguanine synthase QueE [Coraliihabitans acroporae]
MGGVPAMTGPAIIRVSEIFGPTIQGEGALIGAPTVFVRTGGCDYRCAWCDSLHAVDNAYRADWQAMSHEAVWDEVVRLSSGTPLWVSLSGGNPAIQPLGGLIARGKAAGYRFAMETQGSIVKPWFDDLDMLILSPKPPSSGMETDWQRLEACLAAGAAHVILKIVVFDEADFAFARRTAQRYPGVEVVLQPGNHTPPSATDDTVPVDMAGVMDRMDWLVARTLDDRWFEARVLPQLHVALWGNRRGV